MHYTLMHNYAEILLRIFFNIWIHKIKKKRRVLKTFFKFQNKIENIQNGLFNISQQSIDRLHRSGQHGRSHGEKLDKKRSPACSF